MSNLFIFAKLHYCLHCLPLDWLTNIPMNNYSKKSFKIPRSLYYSIVCVLCCIWAASGGWRDQENVHEKRVCLAMLCREIYCCLGILKNKNAIRDVRDYRKYLRSMWQFYENAMSAYYRYSLHSNGRIFITYTLRFDGRVALNWNIIPVDTTHVRVQRKTTGSQMNRFFFLLPLDRHVDSRNAECDFGYICS